MPPLRHLVVVSLCLLPVGFGFSQEKPQILPNGGFEKGVEGWELQGNQEAFQALPEAASMGKLGLRIVAEKSGRRSSLSSPKFPAEPGHIYRATFWGKMLTPPGARVQLEFYDANGKPCEPVLTKGYWPAAQANSERGFGKFILQVAAPDLAATLAVKIDTDDRTKSVSDIDDIVLEEVSLDAATRPALPPPMAVDALLAEIKADPTRGKAPPKIVLKLDDFAIGWAKGPMTAIHHHWQRIAKFAQDRKIKVGIGVVAKGLETASPEALAWMKQEHDSGLVEFWLHGYDHAGWTTADGKPMPEGRGRSVEEQAQRIALCQKIAMEKLGYPFVSYGPTGSGPGPLIDEAFLESLQTDPYMKDIMYPSPLDDLGRKLAAKGKVVILDRVWPVNIEAIVGHPRFDVFLEGYAHNRGRDYLILQGHPPLWGWDDTEKNEAYGDFLKIVDFLQAQGAVFMTPEECAASVKEAAKP